MSQPESFSFDPDTQQFLESYATGEVDWGHGPTASQERAIGLQLIKAGRTTEAEFCLKSAYRKACHEDKPTLVNAIRLDLARALLEVSPGKALNLLTEIQQRRDEVLNQACLYSLVGGALFGLCQFRLAEKNFLAAIEKASDSSDSLNKSYLAYAVANRSQSSFQLGSVTIAEELSREANSRLDELGDESNRGLVSLNAGIHYMLRGAYDNARNMLDRSEEIQVRVCNERLAGFLSLNAAELDLAAGELDSGVARLLSPPPKISAPPGLNARALIWRSIIQCDKGGAGLLKDFEAVARDLYSRDLREDSAIVSLITAAYAAREGLSGERYFESARTIFCDQPGFRYLADHYARIIASITEARRSFKEQELPLFLTQAPQMVTLKAKLHRLAKTDVRLLIEGESGTGKTFLARLIHEEGERRHAPFIVVDCTNLEENLFESKLFGHLRGSFTGAITDSVGLVEQANKGTLFLDEIGELPTDIQAKLLYTIEEQRYRPIGARMEKQADFRVIAATNRDIDQMLEDGTLRRDLFFRVAGYRVLLPPLRDRREDIVPLVEHQLRELNRRYGRRKILRAQVWETIVLYDWPGNVRELNAALERGFYLSTGRYIGLDDLGLGTSGCNLQPDELSWYHFRRAHVLRVLKLCRGNVTRAARMLGLNRTTLIYKLKLLDIQRRDFDPSHRESKQASGDDPLRWVAEEDANVSDPELDEDC